MTPREPRITGLRRLLPRPGASVEREVDDELAFHLESRTRELMLAGASEDDARRQAEAEFGDLRASRRELADVDRRRRRRDRASRWIETTMQDLRYATRVLRRAPGYAATVIICVALGVGLTTTIVAAVNAILLRPLPYPDADRLVAVYAQNPGMGYRGSNISYPDYVSWRDDSRSFEGMGIWTWRSYTLSSGAGDAERVEGAEVAANLFDILGVKPILGRRFLPGEDRLGNERVAVIGKRLWERWYGGDSSIIGKTVTVDAVPYRVVGVMPDRFAFPDRGELWTPFAVDLKNEGRGNRGYAGAIARLKAGVTLAQGQADLARVSAQLARDYSKDNEGWAAEPTGLRESLTGDLRRPLLVFLGAVVLVLIIACANVANLSLSRGVARARELSVRVAIGADRGRLMRQLLTEAMLLTLIGGALGALLATFGVRTLSLAFPNGTPFYIDMQLDWPTLGIALLISVLAGAVFGTIPAATIQTTNVGDALRDRGGEGSSRLAWARPTLVGAEIALSVVLMVGAGLLVRSYQRLTGQDLGFIEQDAMTFKVALPRESYPTPAQRLSFYNNLIERLEATPGVVAAGTAQGVPFSGWDWQGEMMAEGQPPKRAGEDFVSHFQWVSPGFFDALGVKLVAGRFFTDADRDTANIPGIVNELFAKRFFHDASPLGKRVRQGPEDPWITIVGVVNDFQHYRLPQKMGPAIYYPYATRPLLAEAVAVRTKGIDPQTIIPEARAAARALDPNVPVFGARTMEEQVSVALWRQRVQGQVLGLFAVLALILAVVGVYGVVSYGVTQRHRELGVRLALGATPTQVLALVFRQGMKLAVISVVVGIIAATALARTLSELLYGIAALDLTTFLMVPLVLGGAAVVATLIPARRASRVDPLQAIRAD